MKAYVVCAAQGSYEDKDWWAVAVWSSRSLADKDALRLNWCARQLSEARSADPVPPEDDLYDAWKKRRERLLKKWQRLSGDANLNEYEQPTYAVVELPFRNRRSKS